MISLNDRQAEAALGALWYVLMRGAVRTGTKEWLDAWEALTIIAPHIDPETSDNAALVLSEVDQVRAELTNGSKRT